MRVGRAGLMMAIAVAVACSEGAMTEAGRTTEQTEVPDATPAPVSPDAWDIQDFAYQLQRARRDQIASSGFDLVVVSPALAGSTAGVITELKESADFDLTVLAYLSIGQAERYQGYYRPEWDDDPPSWLDEADPDWRGNYWVRYWEPGWQELVFGSPDAMLDEIVALGFDGVYLDRIDTYLFYEEGEGRMTAAEEMITFVKDLADHARSLRPGFGVFPQNAEELIEVDPTYLEMATGIGVEDLYYGYGVEGESSPPNWTAQREALLDHWVEAGKLVLTVDYTDDPAEIIAAYRRSHARGYVPYVTDRALDRLRVNEGFDPTRSPSEWPTDG